MRLPTPLFVCSMLWSASNAFTLQSSIRRISGSTPIRSSTRVLESSTAVAEAPGATSDSKDEELSIYAKIGITKDQLAMGINPDELLEWIGTREIMVEKVMRDISKFDRVQAEQEIDKYLMDPEAINYHIEFKKRLAENPGMIEPVQEDGFFSFRTLVIAYVSYVFGEVVYRNFLQNYVDLSFVPGWGPIPVKEEVVDAVALSAVDAVQITFDAASTAIDAIGSSM